MQLVLAAAGVEVRQEQLEIRVLEAVQAVVEVLAAALVAVTVLVAVVVA